MAKTSLLMYIIHIFSGKQYELHTYASGGTSHETGFRTCVHRSDALFGN